MQDNSNSSPPSAFENKIDSLKSIYSWASKNTSETRQLGEFKYYWSDRARRLLQILELSEGSIIAIVGLSGVGKSSAQIQVARALNDKLSQEVPRSKGRVVNFKWPGYLESNYDRILELLKMQDVNPSDEEVIQFVAENLATSRNENVMTRRLKEVFGDRLSKDDLLLKDRFDRAEIANLLRKGMAKEPPINAKDIAANLLGPSDMNSFNRQLVISLLSSCHTIMIDLRDYGLRDGRAMNTDLNDIQRLWQLMNEHLYAVDAKRAPNLVSVLQKELMMSEDQSVVNYFLRKASQTVELLPFSPAELVQVYKEEFGDVYPFDPETLALLGRYSRGVFRRFLRYIQLCLDWKLSHGDEVVTREIVGLVISEDDIMADWEMEMRQIFPHGEYWRYAARVLKILYTLSENEISPTLTQLGEVTEFVSRSDLWRITLKLEERGYLSRKNTKGGKVISANW